TQDSQGWVNGALFTQTSAHPTGNGIINDFLRVQAKKSSVEQGYNSDAAPDLDTKGGAFTHAIHLSDIPVVMMGGVAYREFLLGLDQSQASPLLSLDQLQIFLGDRGNLSGYKGGKLAGMTAIYDMDAGANNWVALTGALSHGNGTGDACVYIPDVLFTRTADNP